MCQDAIATNTPHIQDVVDRDESCVQSNKTKCTELLPNCRIVSRHAR